jgi:hypothetical protein
MQLARARYGSARSYAARTYADEFSSLDGWALIEVQPALPFLISHGHIHMTARLPDHRAEKL